MNRPVGISPAGERPAPSAQVPLLGNTPTPEAPDIAALLGGDMTLIEPLVRAGIHTVEALTAHSAKSLTATARDIGAHRLAAITRGLSAAGLSLAAAPDAKRRPRADGREPNPWAQRTIAAWFDAHKASTGRPYGVGGKLEGREAKALANLAADLVRDEASLADLSSRMSRYCAKSAATFPPGPPTVAGFRPASWDTTPASQRGEYRPMNGHKAELPNSDEAYSDDDAAYIEAVAGDLLRPRQVAGPGHRGAA